MAAPDEPRRCAGRGASFPAENARLCVTRWSVTEAIRQGPQGDGGICMKSALGFYVAPSRRVGFRVLVR